MLTKIYFGIWAIVGIVAAIIFLAGGMTMLVLTAFGFIAFGLVFMGMMGVLPIEVTHPSHVEPVEPRAVKQRANARETAVKVGDAVASYFDPKKLTVQKVRHP